MDSCQDGENKKTRFGSDNLVNVCIWMPSSKQQQQLSAKKESILSYPFSVCISELFPRKFAKIIRISWLF